jgi:hypothetical protein
VTIKCVFYSQILSVLVYVKQSKYVGVLDELHDGNFPLDLLKDGLGQLVLVDDLDCNLLAQDAVGAKFDEA